MSSRALIAIVAWSCLAIAVVWGWSHWSGAVTSESHLLDGMPVHVTTVHEPESRVILLATGVVWALGVGMIVLIGRRRSQPAARTGTMAN